MTADHLCDGCGERTEVHGSSWCEWCSLHIPERAKRRLLKLRNALIEISQFRARLSGKVQPTEEAEIAQKALEQTS